jgi:tetratricopeptide (TPR) repeat protein
LLILVWPIREELLKRFGLLAWLVVLGLAPYVWMVRRSWAAVPINFDGPLESLPEIWFFISRAGYAGVDESVSADWLDRIKFLQFLGSELFWQFALAGTLLALVGLATQWRVLGRRLSAFLTVGFLMPSVVLLLLLRFDYSSATKHVFHVYPLPAYAIFALWMALGLTWLAKRYALQPLHAVTGSVVVLALILAAGFRVNLLADHDWAARYAGALFETLPPNAVVFGRGEADLGPMAYFHMIENRRPDITLYHAQGLVLGNRLFHPLRTDAETQKRLVRQMIDEQAGPVAFTLEPYAGYAQRDRWLYVLVDKSSTSPEKVTVDIPQEAMRFFEESLAGADEPNAWIAYFQGELRRGYATLLARSLPREQPPGERVLRHLNVLAKDYYGALGIAEGMMLNKDGYSVGAVAGFLDKASALMPSDITKNHQSRFFYLRAAVRANMRERPGAIRDFETALSIWPVKDNPAIKALEDAYREMGDAQALDELRSRADRLKPFSR